MSQARGTVHWLNDSMQCAGKCVNDNMPWTLPCAYSIMSCAWRNMRYGNLFHVHLPFGRLLLLLHWPAEDETHPHIPQHPGHHADPHRSTGQYLWPAPAVVRRPVLQVPAGILSAGVSGHPHSSPAQGWHHHRGSWDSAREHPGDFFLNYIWHIRSF